MSRIITKKIKAFDNTQWSVEFFDTPLEVIEVSGRRGLTNTGFINCRVEGGRYEQAADELGVHSWEEAVDLLTHGYNPMVKELKDIAPELIGEGKRITFKNNVEGFAPVVPLALMGVPNCMVSVRMKPIKTKVLDVYYLSCVSHWVTTAQMIKAGKHLLRALLTLEMSGYKFNLYVLQDYSHPHARGEAFLAKIKSSNQPLDLRKMSFILAHPAALRVIGFDWYSRYPEGVYRCDYGTPLARTYPAETLDAALKELTGKPCVTFAAQTLVGMNRYGGNDEAVLEYIKDRLTGGNTNGRR